MHVERKLREGPVGPPILIGNTGDRLWPRRTLTGTWQIQDSITRPFIPRFPFCPQDYHTSLNCPQNPAGQWLGSFTEAAIWQTRPSFGPAGFSCACASMMANAGNQGVATPMPVDPLTTCPTSAQANPSRSKSLNHSTQSAVHVLLEWAQFDPPQQEFGSDLTLAYLHQCHGETSRRSSLASALRTAMLIWLLQLFVLASQKRSYCYVYTNQHTLVTKLNLGMLKGEPPRNWLATVAASLQVVGRLWTTFALASRTANGCSPL